MRKIALPFLVGFLFLSLLLIGCASDPGETTMAPPTTTEYDLQVVVNSGRLRAEAGPDAPTLKELEKGSLLMDLEEVSRFTTVIRFGEESTDEPWLAVQTATGESGWIYGRDVAPIAPDADISAFRQQKKLRSMFGPGLTSQLQQYRQKWDAAQSAEAVAAIYQEGLGLRDSLVRLLEQKSAQYHDQTPPDLFWIDEYLPGYVSQLIAGNSAYYLFNDYGKWQQKASRSTGNHDDRFFNILIKCYPQDSVEFFTPSWEVPGSTFGTHNLLGRGLVYSILADIEQLQQQTTLFSALLLNIKDQILEGITTSRPHYWEADSLVRQELDTIMHQKWSIFTSGDRIALEARRMQLDSADLHGIRFNARAGE